MAPFYGWNSTVLSHCEETAYFLPLNTQTFLVLIWLTWKGWTAELTSVILNVEPPGLRPFFWTWDPEVGIWTQESRSWDLNAGTLKLGFERRNPEVGIWTWNPWSGDLNVATLKLGFEGKTPEVEIWTWKLWSWDLNVGTLKLGYERGTPKVEIWTWDPWSWDLNTGTLKNLESLNLVWIWDPWSLKYP